MDNQKQSEIFREWLKEHKGILFKIIRVYADADEDQEDLFQEISLQLWIKRLSGLKKRSTEVKRERTRVKNFMYWIKSKGLIQN